MRTLSLSPFGLSVCVAAALLAGCGGPLTSDAITVTSNERVSFSDSGVSGHLPTNLAVKQRALVYVASVSGCANPACHPVLSVYTLGGRYRGGWTGKPISYLPAACADDAGNVYLLVFGSSGQVLKFAHGGTKPIKTLDVPAYIPISCSVDHGTGDLAVVADFQSDSALFVYPKGSGSPAEYVDSNLYLQSVSYDDSGNAFVEGIASYARAGFAELPSGKNTFKAIVIKRHRKLSGDLMFDGAHLTIAEYGNGKIYRLSIRKDQARIEGVTPLLGPNGGPCNCEVVSFRGDVVAGSYWSPVCVPELLDLCVGYVGLWHYPVGGRPFATLGYSYRFNNPYAVLSI